MQVLAVNTITFDRRQIKLHSHGHTGKKPGVSVAFSPENQQI